MFRITDEIPKKRIKLDVKDKKILVLLSEYSRMPLSEIAKKVQLSRDTVAYRINRMQKLGVILGFYPEIDFKRLGYNLYHVFFLIDETNKEKQQQLINTLVEHPNTRSVIQYSDRWDIELILIAKDIEEFDSIVTDIAGKFSSIIMEKEKLAQIGTYYSILFPYEFYKEIGEIKVPGQIEESDYKPDQKDMQILKVLAKDCRQSTYEIAKHVSLSADAVGLRIKRLYKTGVIKKFTILANLTNLGYSWYTFSLQMKVFDKTCESKFKTFVKDHPNIIKAVKVLGAWDLLLYIISEGPRDFHQTIKQIKNEFSDTVNSYQTWVAYKESIFQPIPKVLNV